MPDRPGAKEGLTQWLVERCMQARFRELPADVRVVAAQCVLDCLGSSLAAVREPAPDIVLSELASRGGLPEATAIGRDLRLPAACAAEYNGTLAHALDYDDVHLAITGHATAVVLPALLALAEQRGDVSGASLLAALVAGCEMACRVGRLIAPSHYARGFHSTATAGALGAAVACAHLAGLSQEQARIALGLAATQSSGLKAMFGSMGKPWHAGLAARNGLMAVQLAARGFTGPADILESPQGFARAYSDDFHIDAALEEPPGGWHLRNTLFKYHASCYGTHAAMEALMMLQREHGFTAEEVAAIDLRVHDSCANVCDIRRPGNDTEARFSLNACAAMTLAGLDTSSPQEFSSDSLAHPQVHRLIPRVELAFGEEIPKMASEVRVRLENGRAHRVFHDAGVPAIDLRAQQEKVEAKFATIAGGVFGSANAARLSQAVRDLGETPLEPLLTALRSCIL